MKVMAMNPNDAIPDISEVQKHINLSEKQVAFLNKLNAESVTAAKAEDALIGQLISDAKMAIRAHVQSAGCAPTAYRLKFASVDDEGTKKFVIAVSDNEMFKNEVD